MTAKEWRFSRGCRWRFYQVEMQIYSRIAILQSEVKWAVVGECFRLWLLLLSFLFISPAFLAFLHLTFVCSSLTLTLTLTLSLFSPAWLHLTLTLSRCSVYHIESLCMICAAVMFNGMPFEMVNCATGVEVGVRYYFNVFIRNSCILLWVALQFFVRLMLLFSLFVLSLEPFSMFL